MGKTKKVKSTGRLGSRYGVGIRKKLLKVEGKQQRNYKCPFCGFKKVKRKAAGLFACRKCHAKFAGGAYLPVTLPGSIIKKTVAQKGFASKGKKLEKEIEQALPEEPRAEKPEAKAENKPEKQEKKPGKGGKKPEKGKLPKSKQKAKE